MAAVRRLVSQHYGAGQVAVVLVAFATYELGRLFLRPNWELAERHAQALFAWERSAHLAWEASLQQKFLRLPPLVEAMNAFYLVGNVACTGLFFVWLYRRSRPGFRLFRNGFLLASAFAFSLEWRFPVAPPRLAGIGVEDTLRRLSGIDIGSPGVRGLTDPVAAFPSLHAGWALGVGVGLIAYGGSRLARALGVLYPLAVDLTIIVTGNHFVTDVLAGTGIVLAGLVVASAMASREGVNFNQRRGVEQPGSSPGS